MLGKIPWLSRVPLSIKEAKKLVQNTSASDLKASQIEGYRLAEYESCYGGIKQRWLLIQNDKRRDSDLLSLEKQINKALITQEKALKKLSQQAFDHAKDAKKAAQQLQKKMKYHRIKGIKAIKQVHYETRGRPSKSTIPTKKSYTVQAKLVENLTEIEAAKQQAGRFVLASNDIKESKDRQEKTSKKEHKEEESSEKENYPRFTNNELLKEYKEQQCAERGFRFLKDPLFFASSIFVKTARRVATLAMIMAVCLLVYTIGQRMLRQNLQKAEETLPNQLGKPTKHPTLRWIFQCFQAVHIIWINEIKQISNLTEDRLRILKFFSPQCRKYYFVDRFT